MELIQTFLDPGNWFAVILLIGILCFVGGRMVELGSGTHRWSLRLAAAGFVTYAVLAATASGANTPEQFVEIGLRSLLAAGLVLGLCWTLLPIADFLYGHSVGAMLAAIRRYSAAAQASRAAARRRREQERLRIEEQAAYDRLAPERERAMRQAQEHARQQGETQRRIEDARATCELLYNLHAHEIGDRFTREIFNDWLTRYMGHGQEPQYVENRGHQLQGIIRDLVKQVRPAEQPQTIAELKAWRSQLREQIIDGEENPEAREDQFLELDRRYEELQKRIIRGDLP